MTTPASSPNYRTGKICYIEMPAIDIAQSAQFYQQIFGWHIRQHDDGSTAFDDTVGGVSGMWVTGRPPAANPGMIVSIMVANAAATIEAISRRAERSYSRSTLMNTRSMPSFATPR
ncbi:MAG TPA: VOC family protein, partial [Ktedonobacteraceae bacterium]|nr:VOC family protein [Ktedonobacteraceae bacterium]